MILAMKKFTAAFLIASIVFFTSVPAVLADNDLRPGDGERMGVRNTIKQEVKSEVKDLRTKSCEARMETIVNRSNSLTQRAQKMEEKFASIASRVEEFYTNKLVPAGITVSNYDSLVAEISTKKDAVDTALSEAKDKALDSDCSDVSTAKGRIGEYRQAMIKVIRALKEYRTAIKNLIVAVRTAAKDLKPSPSPES